MWGGGTQALVVGHRAGRVFPCSILATLLSIPAVTPAAPSISRSGVESFMQKLHGTVLWTNLVDGLTLWKVPPIALVIASV